MALVVSILLASVILALAIVYALLGQMLLFRIFDFNITRRRKKAFFFWNSIAFVFKVVLPVFFLIPSGFLALFWLEKGIKSVKRSFEEDYHQERHSIPWWSIMLLTWLLAFPLSQLTVALCMGGHPHMHAHHSMNLFGPEPKGDCVLCRLAHMCLKCGTQKRMRLHNWNCPKCETNFFVCEKCGQTIQDMGNKLVCPKCDGRKCEKCGKYFWDGWARKNQLFCPKCDGSCAIIQ